MNNSIPTNSSVSIPNTFSLKGEANALQERSALAGEKLARSAALEQIARKYGFKDWNAAKAAADRDSNAPVMIAYPFEAIDRPLPQRRIRFHRAGDTAQQSISELLRWAAQLEFIATRLPASDRRTALDLIGGARPYVFVMDSGRWPDLGFRLCNRGYFPMEGITFSQEQLEALGLEVWNRNNGSHGGSDMYSVVSDDVLLGSDPLVLRQAARLLASIAAAVAPSL